MKAFSFILAAMAAPAVLCCNAAAADEAPAALKGMLPCNDTFIQGTVVRIERDPEYIKLEQEVQQAFAKLPQDKQKAFAEKYDPSTLPDYNADIWPDKAAYDKYVELRKKSRIIGTMEVALGLKKGADGTYSVLSATKVGDGVAPITIGALHYDPAKNVWISNNGELTASPFSAGDNYDFHAQTGTEWKLTKEDRLSKLAEMVRVSKTTDGKIVYVAYGLTEVSAISGTVIAQHGYMLAFPQGTPNANATKPGQK